MENQVFLNEFLKDSLYIIDTEVADNKQAVLAENNEKESLITNNDVQSTESNNQTSPVDLKGIIVIIKQDELSADVRDFLTKILSAANLNDADYSLFFTQNGQDLPFSIVDVTGKFLVFGISPFELGVQAIQVNKYHLAVSGESQYLWGDALGKIKDDANAKKALWLNMKKMFNV